MLLVDDVGAEVFGRLDDGARSGCTTGAVLRRRRAGGAPGASSDADDDRATLMDEARSGLSTQLQSFAHNTTEFLRREQDLLLHGQGVPELAHPHRRPAGRRGGRAATTTARTCAGCAASSASSDPVLVGVDAGADALLAAGHRPDIVVVGRTAWPAARRSAAAPSPTRRCAAAREVVVHADRAGRARRRRTGSSGSASGTATLAAAGTTRGRRAAARRRARRRLIVAVGTHATLDEFLDRQRSGLASTFLTRLRVGPQLVDAKGVPALYSGRVRAWHLLAGAARRPARRWPWRSPPPRSGDDWWSSIGGALVRRYSTGSKDCFT